MKDWVRYITWVALHGDLKLSYEAGARFPVIRRNGRRNFQKVESEMYNRRGWSLVHLLNSQG